MNPRLATALVIGMALVGAALAWAVTATGSDTYAASALLTERPGGAAPESRQAAATTARLINIDSVVQRALQRLPADTRDDAARTVEAHAFDGTYLIEVTARSGHAASAAAAANAFAGALVDHRASSELGRRTRATELVERQLARLTRRSPTTSRERELLVGRLADLQAAAALPRSEIEVVEEATPPTAPEARPTAVAMAIGCAGGGVLGLLLLAPPALLARSSRTAPRPDGDAKTLATLPRHRSLGRPLASRGEPLDVAAAVALLADEFERECLGCGARTTLVASARRFDGRSIVSLILARELARRDKKVLLVEGDLANPSLSDHTGQPGTPGLAQLAGGSAKIEEALHRVGAGLEQTAPSDGGTRWKVHRRATGGGGSERRNPSAVRGRSVTWDLLPAGSRVERPGYVLSSPTIVALLRDAAASYDAVLIDCPAGAEADGVLDLADAVLIVERRRATARREEATFVRWLRDAAHETPLRIVTNATTKRRVP